MKVEEIGDPEEFSGTVTKGGQPITDVILKLQPIAKGGTEAAVPVTNGKYKATATPGLYTYYFEEGSSAATYEATIPKEYRLGSLEREIEVTGDDLDLTVD